MSIKNALIVGLILTTILVQVWNMQQVDSIIELKEFNSIEQLESWLSVNDVNNNTYITDTYDCDDFALDLVNDAIQEGYAIYSMGSGTVYYKTTIMYNTNNETFYYGKELIELINHAYCVTKINGIWYQIEPQNDEITELGKEF